MKQPGLIDCVISAVGLEYSTAKGKYTPSGSVPLFKNEDVVPASGSFNYSRIIGMMLYLSGRTHPYIEFAINFCSIYMFSPNNMHKYSLKKLVGI